MQFADLRHYQQGFYRQIGEAVKRSGAVIAQLPTGGGKTKIFLAISLSAVGRGKTVLIITESKKIYAQIQAEAKGIDINAGVAEFFLRPGNVYIAMAQTLMRRPLLVQQFADMTDSLLVITDEAHIGTPVSLLRQLTSALNIGFTATPFYPLAKHLPELYRELVHGPQVTELQAQRYLCTYRHYARVGMETDKLQIKNGEFTEASQEEALENTVVFDGIKEDLRQVPFNHCLIFCSSIRHCQHVARELRDAGHEVVEVHTGLNRGEAKGSRERQSEDYNLYLFTSGRVRICVSVGKLTKGFDYPPIDLIVIMRATNSLPLYLQMCGRASRMSEGKEGFVCLDYGGNWQRFGLWDADRDWHELWRPQRRRRGEGRLSAPAVKLCPVCSALIAAAATKCPHCGAELPRAGATPVEERDSELIEITEAYTKIKGKRLSQLAADELALFARFKNKRMHAIRVAKAREQQEEGYLRAFARAMGYKGAWVWQQERETRGAKIEFTDAIVV